MTLGEGIDIKHGYAFKGKYFKNEPPGDVLLTPGNFAIGGGFKDDKLKYYDGPVPEEFILDEDDLLVTMTDLSKQTDTLGFPAFVPSSSHGERYLHNQRLGKIFITNNDLLDIGFLFYLMCSREYRNEVLATATGTTVKHTSPTRIKNYRFRCPPLPEQRAIAHILGTLDDKIELNRRMNATLEALARALFKSWFVDFDPVWEKIKRKEGNARAQGRKGAEESTHPGAPSLPEHILALFPDGFEASALGDIPRGWRVKPIKHCCMKVQNGGTPRRSEAIFWTPATVPWLTSGEVRQNLIIETEKQNLRNRTSKELSKVAAKLFDSGRTLWCYCGASCIDCFPDDN